MIVEVFEEFHIDILEIENYCYYYYYYYSKVGMMQNNWEVVSLEEEILEKNYWKKKMKDLMEGTEWEEWISESRKGLVVTTCRRN